MKRPTSSAVAAVLFSCTALVHCGSGATRNASPAAPEPTAPPAIAVDAEVVAPVVSVGPVASVAPMADAPIGQRPKVDLVFALEVERFTMAPN